MHEACLAYKTSDESLIKHETILSTLAKSKTESAPLSDEEILDIDEFYSNKSDHKIRSLDELLEELHSD
ncbi:MAG: hypothetical protein DA330_08210 [Nitrososphaera sp.]|nr:hypothetical protein [Nitrososphaera sp.]